MSEIKQAIAMLVLLLIGWANASGAAQSREWVTLACAYIAHPANDGDSFRVLCGSEKFVLRLYFVDTPEATLTYPERVREQGEHFGATIDETLRAGAQARDFVRQILAKPFVVITRRAIAPGRGEDVRYYGMVKVAGRNLHEILIEEGLARNKGVSVNMPTGEKSRTHVEKLRKSESSARVKKRGIWKESKGTPSKK